MEQFTKNVASEHSMPMIDKVNPDSFISGETVADEAYFNDGGSWTALAIADTFSEIGTTGVYEISLTAAERNHDQIIIKMTSTNSQDNSIKINAIPAPANMKEIEEDALSGNNAIFRIRQLHIRGQGAEAAIDTQGGPTGPGARYKGGSTSANGVEMTGSVGGGAGFSTSGNGGSPGTLNIGGPTGNGLENRGGSTSGDGIKSFAQGGNSNGTTSQGFGTGKDINAFEIDILGYPNGYIVYNPGATTNTGTVKGTDGTTNKPVTTMAAALNLKNQLGTKKILCIGPTGESVNGLNMENTEFKGVGLITLNGITAASTTAGSVFHNIQLSGLFIMGLAEFRNCRFSSPNAANDYHGRYYNCGFFSGTYKSGQAESGEPLLQDCYNIPGENAVIFEDSGQIIVMNNWNGRVIVNLLNFGDAEIYMSPLTFLTTNSINATDTTFILRGLGNFVNNSGGTIPDLTDFVDVSDIDTGDEAFYPDGFINMSTTASNTSTVLRVDGTYKNPVSTLAAAKTLAEALGSKKIKILGAGALTLTAGSWNNFEIVGQTNFFNLGLTLTGSTPLNTTFRNLTINGTHNTSNRNRFISCLINSTNMFGDCFDCAFNSGPITVDDSRLVNCYPQNLITTTLAVNLSSDVNIVQWGGNLKIGAVSAGGSLDINLQGGELELTSAFNGGTMRATGYGKVTDNSTSGIIDVSNFFDIETDTLTSQQARDAMKLAPTAGGGAIKSIDAAIIDPIPEPAAGLPPVNPTMLQKMQYFWATWRNVSTETVTEQKIRNDAGTELAKRPSQNDDGITFTNSKWTAP